MLGHLLRVGVRAGLGGKRACTVWPKTGAFTPSSPPVRPISAASRLSSLSKRCEVEVSEWLRLAVRR